MNNVIIPLYEMPPDVLRALRMTAAASIGPPMTDDADSWDALVREHELLWGLGTVALPLDGLRAALAREGYLEQPPLRGLSSRASFEVLASAARLRRGDDFELGSSERNMWLVMRDVARLRKLSCQHPVVLRKLTSSRVAV